MANFYLQFRYPSLGVTLKDIDTYRDFINSELVVEKLEKDYGNNISKQIYDRLPRAVKEYYSESTGIIAINKIDYRKILEKGAS